MLKRQGSVVWTRQEISRQLQLTDHVRPDKVALWLDALSIPDAQARREGVTKFLRYCVSSMQGLPVLTAFDFARAIDFSKNVDDACLLKEGDRVIASRQPGESPFKLFYTLPGASVHRSGVIPGDRTTRKFKVKRNATVFKSHTTGVIDNHSPIPVGAHVSVDPRGAPPLGVMAWGGNVQLIIPDSALVLDLA